jgi:DNA polymerase-2
MTEVRRTEAFLLSREWRDADDGVELILWARSADGPARVRIGRQEAVMFVPRDAVTYTGRRVPRELTTFDGRPIDALYFRSRRALYEERDRLRTDGVETLESDVKPSDRWLMERFITGGLTIEGPCRTRGSILYFDRGVKVTPLEHLRPTLTSLALDIETDGVNGPLLSAAVAMPGYERVFVRRPASHAAAVVVPDERTLLVRLFAEIVALDPDVICGWNVLEFDLALLDQRAQELRVPFTIGRGGERARVLASTSGRLSIARVPGRVILDGIATLKSATYSFDRFNLEFVSQKLLGRGKAMAHGVVDPIAEIRRLFAEAPDELVEYNLEDCRLVLDIFRETDLLGFAMERAQLTGLPMDRQGGSVAAFDHLYLPRIHRRGVVARDVESDIEIMPSPGGHVLDSEPGLYRDVLAFDFRSLYPSIIRTFQIDPLGLAQPGENPVPGEDGAAFARTGAILPQLISSLHDARSVAMGANNAALSRAIKILMNSFYGVLGTPGCRFFDARLPTSITRRGHAIIERARRFFADRVQSSRSVIYGDTDSLFVAGLNPAAGPALAKELTALLAQEIRDEYDLESFLELRFDAHYVRFLMPTTRNAERGSKKRYAGLVQKANGKTELVVRGLEAVRRDWTPLARRIQLELLNRVFHDEAFDAWLLQTTKDLAAGKLDEELVYRKSKKENDVKEELVLVMTGRGLEPVHETTAPIDYAHYLDKQIAPVCDVILPFLDTSFSRVAGAQTSLF